MVPGVEMAANWKSMRFRWLELKHRNAAPCNAGGPTTTPDQEQRRNCEQRQRRGFRYANPEFDVREERARIGRGGDRKTRERRRVGEAKESEIAEAGRAAVGVSVAVGKRDSNHRCVDGAEVHAKSR